MRRNSRAFFDGEDAANPSPDNWEWVTLLSQSDQKELLELEQARSKITNKIKRENRFEDNRLLKKKQDALFRNIRQPSRKSAVRKFLSTHNDETWMEILLQEVYQSQQYHIFQIILALAVCVVYIVETYYFLGDFPGQETFYIIEILFTGIFILDYILGILSSKDIVRFIWDWSSIADLLSILPGLLLVFMEEPLLQYLVFLRMFRASRILRLYRISTFTDNRGHYLENFGGFEVGGQFTLTAEGQKKMLLQRVLQLCLTVASIVFVATGLVFFLQILENEEAFYDQSNPAPFYFHDAMYFVVMTLFTVGYGDVTPISRSARLVTALTVVVFVLCVPYLFIELITCMRSHSEFLNRYQRKNIREKHVVLTGSITYHNLLAFLGEFSLYEGNLRTRVVILNPQEPSAKIMSLLHSSQFKAFTLYLKGTPLNNADLERAGTASALAVVLMTKMLVPDSKHEDRVIMLQAMSIQTFLHSKRSIGVGPHILVALNRPQSSSQCRELGIQYSVSNDQIKLSCVAQSILCPGWNALLLNLLRTHDEPSEELFKNAIWYREYYQGASKRLFLVRFSPFLVGQTFSSVAAQVYERFELIILAVENESSSQVIMNPGENYMIGPADKAFVLAEMNEAAEQVWTYMEGAEKGQSEIPYSILSINSYLDHENTPPSPKPRRERSRMVINEVPPEHFDLIKACNEALFRSRRAKHLPQRAKDMKMHRAKSAYDLNKEDKRGKPRAIQDEMKMENDMDMQGKSNSYYVDEDKKGKPRIILQRQKMKQAEKKRPLFHSRKISDISMDSWASAAAVSELVSADVQKLNKSEAQSLLERLQKEAKESSPAPSNLSTPDQSFRFSDLKINTSRHRNRKMMPTPRIYSSPIHHIKSAESRTNYEMQDASNHTGHIVVTNFDKTPSHMECFLSQLAGKQDILFLIRNSRSKQFASALRQVEKAGQVSLKGVYFLVGSPVSRRCLSRAGIRGASAVICFSNAHFMPWTFLATANEQGSPDTDTLLSLAKMAPLLRPDCHLIVELLQDASLRFLHSSYGGKHYDTSILPNMTGVYLWPLFAAGKVYTSTSLNTLITQAVFRPSIVNILEELLAMPLDSKANIRTNPMNQYEHGGQQTAGDSESSESEEQKNVNQPKPVAPTHQSAVLRQIPVPPSFYGRLFGELAQNLLAPPCHAVPVGLYRGRGTNQSPDNYVYTAPRADTSLQETDKVYILIRYPNIQNDEDETIDVQM